MLDKERPKRDCTGEADNRKYFPTHQEYLTRLWARHATIIDVGEDAIIPDEPTEKEIKKGTWWRQLLAGGIAGAVSRTATAPLDRIKIFFQVHSKKEVHSITKTLEGMIKEGGYRSLWRGNLLNVMKIAPETAFKFTAYEQIKRLFASHHGPTHELRLRDRFISGSLAGALSQSIIYPLEVLKTRMSLRKSGQYRNLWHAITTIYKTEGLRAFYRGFSANLIGIVPYAGTDLAIYETLRKYIHARSDPDKKPGILLVLFCATVSSTCGQITSYPLALLRTRMQASTVVKMPDATLSGEIKRIFMTDGIFGFYRGLTANFIKVIPAVGISYVVYEYSRVALGIPVN